MTKITEEEYVRRLDDSLSQGIMSKSSGGLKKKLDRKVTFDLSVDHEANGNGKFDDIYLLCIFFLELRL